MKILYSVAGRGPRHIGFFLKEILQYNLDLKIIMAEGDFSETCEVKARSFLFDKIMFLFRYIAPKSLSNIKFQNIMLKVYDSIVSRMLRKTNIDIFHHYGAPHPISLKTAKEIGARTFLQVVNAHVLFDMKIIEEEARFYGVSALREPVFFSYILNKDKRLKAYGSSDYIICRSDFARDTFIQNGITPTKLKVIVPGVDVQRFKPGKKVDNTFRILFVGRITLAKGIKYLLEAYSQLRLKGAELVLVGPVENDLAEWIKKVGNKTNVRLTGFVPNPIPFYQNSSIFVLPSVTEGCARVILEAMA